MRFSLAASSWRVCPFGAVCRVLTPWPRRSTVTTANEGCFGSRLAACRRRDKRREHPLRVLLVVEQDDGRHLLAEGRIFGREARVIRHRKFHAVARRNLGGFGPGRTRNCRWASAVEANDPRKINRRCYPVRIGSTSLASSSSHLDLEGKPFCSRRTSLHCNRNSRPAMGFLPGAEPLLNPSRSPKMSRAERAARGTDRLRTHRTAEQCGAIDLGHNQQIARVVAAPHRARRDAARWRCARVALQFPGPCTSALVCPGGRHAPGAHALSRRAARLATRSRSTPEPVLDAFQFSQDRTGRRRGAQQRRQRRRRSPIARRSAGCGAGLRSRLAHACRQHPGRSTSTARSLAGRNATENLLIKGAGSTGTVGAAGAIDRITNEILLSLDERPTLVVWLFDQSGSLKAQRESIAERFDRVYDELGVIEASGNPAFRRHDDKPLLTAVASFGESIELLTQRSRPTTWPRSKKSVRAVADDPSGRENVFQSVRFAGRQVSPLSTANAAAERDDRGLHRRGGRRRRRSSTRRSKPAASLPCRCLSSACPPRSAAKTPSSNTSIPIRNSISRSSGCPCIRVPSRCCRSGSS